MKRCCTCRHQHSRYRPHRRQHMSCAPAGQPRRQQ